MIGIIDENFLNKKRGLSPPSLSAMKMAAYLKKTKKDSIFLLSSFEQISSCDEVYFFSDKILENIPKEIFLYDNVTLYGDFLEPLPQIVEHMIPDIGIYKNIVQEKISTKQTTVSRAIQFLDSIYYKAYGENGERLPIPPSSTRKRFYIYDNDFLGYKDSWEILDEINKRLPSAIYMTKPIQCHNTNQFFKLREDYETVSRMNKIILDYFVPLQDLEIYFGKYKLRFLGEITKTSNVCIYMGKNYITNAYGETFYIKDLFYCLNLIFSYWSRNIPIRAEIYHQQEITNPYEDIYEAIRLWTNRDDNLDVPLRMNFGTKKMKEKMEKLIKTNSLFLPFFDKSKEELITTRGIWKIP